ncbi:hypothetical protein BGZ96_005761, partial [Linnemannia gamsii]
DEGDEGGKAGKDGKSGKGDESGKDGESRIRRDGISRNGSSGNGNSRYGSSRYGSSRYGSSSNGRSSYGSSSYGSSSYGEANTATANTATANTATAESEYQLCAHALKHGGGYQRRTAHMVECHADIYQALKQFRRLQRAVHARNMAVQWQDQSNLATPDAKGGYDGVRSEVLKIVQQATPEEQARFENFLMQLVARLNISFYAIDSDLFRDMFHHVNPSYKIPRTATLQLRLDARVSDWKSDMIDKLPTLMYCGSITMDSWTDGTGDRKFL